MTHLPDQLTSSATPAEISCDALVIGAFAGSSGAEPVEGAEDLDSALDGHLSNLPDHKGSLGEVLVIPSLGRVPARSIVVVGLGPRPACTRATLCSAAAVAAKKLSERNELASVLHYALDDRASGARAVAEGYAFGSYRFVAHKSRPNPTKIQRVVHIGADEEALELGTLAGRAAIEARDLINEPAAVLNPEEFARRAQETADINGLGCEILDEDELRARGFGGLLAVAQGAEAPPRMIKLTYEPDNPTGNIALVGKGVTFDSGGLSLKPAASMELMKTDMAGGAVVLAVMGTLKRLGVSAKVTGYIPATENMTGGAAMRPGDVITHYGGTTVEVINTDAEGRLILADALAWASEEGADTIVDVATLTGSMTVALGKKASGLFSNDDGLRDELLEAAGEAGERTWPFPLYEDYLDELKSDVADHKNSGIRWGGAIIAAMLLKQFVGEGIRWAHMDIAGTGRSERDYLEISRGGTGIPVRTLMEWLRTRYS